MPPPGATACSTPRANQQVDGPPPPIKAHRSIQRRQACGAPVDAWQDLPAAAGGPGRSALAGCGAGIVISDISDASDFRNEVVEIYFDP